MRSLKTIAGYNLLAILIYSALIRLVVRGDGMGILVVSAFAVGLHVIIALIISGVSAGDKKKDVARAWLLSALIVLLVGFSACLGNAAL